MFMWREEIKRISLILIFGVFFIQKGLSQNQPIKINIQLPAGVGLSAKSSQSGTSLGGKNAGLGSSGISESTKVNYALIDGNGMIIPLVWIQMKSLENSQFIVDFRDENDHSVEEALYFLNDQTDDLPASIRYEQLPVVLNFDDSNLLIRNRQPRQASVKAWLGFTTNYPGSKIILEYF
ncbi:hypothetical protein AO498_06235 [Algoriphagus sanaruensis]|uniref:Uncharacterized protein n=2 Tax=Algoriphagus sanaruensis TaxID=1727163 RepID=A0A142ELJ9_9BACT|nr:hypothetical protein AO498_06235 [Algoriphagus sanaruensis]